MAGSRITLKEVAAHAGVSFQTVSKVLNRQAQVTEETRRRIWDAIEELGYRPNNTARSLRSQRSKTIGYAWAPSPPEQANPILDKFLQSMLYAAEQKGYYLLCFPLHFDRERKLDSYREVVATNRVDAIVLSHVEYNDERIAFLSSQNIPFVAFGRSNQEIPFPYIDVDGGQGIRMVMNHLLEQGHQRIGVLAWPEDSRVGNNRLEGYFSALAQAGIPANPAWIIRGEGTYNFGREGIAALLSLPADTRPTAVVALNDMMAIGAMSAAQESGYRVGKDLAITGFDNIPLTGFLNPPLTSVDQPVWEIGQRLMQILITILEKNEMPQPLGELVAPQLIIRASSTGIAVDQR